MISRNRTTNAWTIAVVALAIVGITIAAAHAKVIYFDDFDGGATSNLHGTTPDVTTGGATWVAAASYKADGSFGPQNAISMSLAFTPVDGEVYTLDAQIKNLGGTQWAQFGFGNGQSTGLWDFGLPAWILLRATDLIGTPYIGSSSKPAWNLGSTYAADDLDVRIVLDTTLGTGNWTATCYAKEADLGPYTEVLAATALTDEGITSIGFCTYNSGDNFGEFNSFSLSTPPPAGTVIIVR